MNVDLKEIGNFVSEQPQEQIPEIPPHLKGLDLPEMLPIFPKTVAVYHFSPADHYELKCFVKDYIASNPATENVWGKNLSTWLNTDKENFLDIEEPIVQKFKSFLSTSFSTLVKFYQWKMSTDHIIPACWVNKITKDGFQQRHNHSNCWVSGTYYLDFKENSSPIRFWDNVGEYNSPYLWTDVDEVNPINSHFVDLLPKEGDLFLWKSNIMHETLPELSDERISIAMNFIPTEIKTGPYSLKVSR